MSVGRAARRVGIGWLRACAAGGMADRLDALMASTSQFFFRSRISILFISFSVCSLEGMGKREERTETGRSRSRAQMSFRSALPRRGSDTRGSGWEKAEFSTVPAISTGAASPSAQPAAELQTYSAACVDLRVSMRCLPCVFRMAERRSGRGRL